MFNGWETWVDIIVVSIIITIIVKTVEKRKALKEEERRKKAMTPAEFSSWLEETNKEEEERKAKVVQEGKEYAKKLNNTPEYKACMNKIALQNNNTVIVYRGFYYDKDEKAVVISYVTYNTSEGYYGYTKLSNFELSKITRDRQRFLQLKKEFEHFGIYLSEGDPTQNPKRKVPKEKY